MDAPRIDFYLVEEPGAAACDAAACRVAETAWRRGHRVHLHADSPESARRLDDLLWTWRDESFVPHAVCGAGDAGASDAGVGGAGAGGAGAGGAGAGASVTIGWGALPEFADDVLLNFDSRVPDGFERFARVAEVIGGADPARAAGRERFRRYRAVGCELKTHRL